MSFFYAASCCNSYHLLLPSNLPVEDSHSCAASSLFGIFVNGEWSMVNSISTIIDHSRLSIGKKITPDDAGAFVLWQRKDYRGERSDMKLKNEVSICNKDSLGRITF